MTQSKGSLQPSSVSRWTGALYLMIIVLALFGEVVVRGGIVVAGDAPATAQNIRDGEALFRLGLVSDLLAFVCDAAVAILLYILLRPVSRTLAMTAAAFRLVGTAVYGVNLLNQLAALVLVVSGYVGTALGAAQSEALALAFMDLHGQGYDVGLVFFGFHCSVLGYVLLRSNRFPRPLGWLLALSGLVYVGGSLVVLLAPNSAEAVMPAYVIPLIGELGLSLWLLVKGPAVEEGLRIGDPSEAS